MVTHRVRGAALVEYAVILVCVTGLAGAGLKGIHRKASRSAETTAGELAVVGAGAGASTRPGGAGPRAESGRSGGGATAKPKPRSTPRKIEKKTDGSDDV